MKCYKCNGTGIDDDRLTCYKCGGTGEVEMTEQEYIQTCNTERLAEVLCIVSVWGYNEGTLSKEEAIQWLKQPHTKE